MHGSPLTSVVLFHLGAIPITRPVATTWGIMLVLALGSHMLTRRMRQTPTRVQAVLEMLVSGIEEQIQQIVGKNARPFLPLIGALFIFLASANLSGVFPGVHAPTARIETPAALALIIFLSVHYFGVRGRGLWGYLKSFAEPKLIMLPLNLLFEVTRTFSLMVRLFGNIMSGEFVVALAVALAGLFIPIPFIALELVLGLVQAYIFSVLATVFIAAAAGAIEKG